MRGSLRNGCFLRHWLKYSTFFYTGVSFDSRKSERMGFIIFSRCCTINTAVLCEVHRLVDIRC